MATVLSRRPFFSAMPNSVSKYFKKLKKYNIIDIMMKDDER